MRFGITSIVTTSVFWGLLTVGCGLQRPSLVTRFPPIVRETGSDYQAPRWSPDGTAVVYSEWARGPEVWIARTDGQAPQRVTPPGVFAFAPDWSPDGRQIIYTGRDNNLGQLFTVNADGSGVKQLTHFAQYTSTPKWSPDGTRIAFTMGTGLPAETQLHVMDADGRNVQQLTRPPLGEVDGFEWSPDSARVAFIAKDVSHETKETQIGEGIGPFLYVMNADGTDLIPVIDRPGVLYLTWSPDGQQILTELFVNTKENSLPKGFYIINSDGSGMQRVLTEGVCREPNWGRANNKLVFVCGQLPDMSPSIHTAAMQDLLK